MVRVLPHVLRSSSPTDLQRQRAYFDSGATLSVEFRRDQLRALSSALQQNEPALLDALNCDLGKSAREAYATEIALIHAEIDTALRNLNRWAAPTRRRTTWLTWPARAWVQSEPLGVALIVGPWNYPAQLLLVPLVSAIAAGNCAVLKPSELAPRTAEVIGAMIRDTFASQFVTIVNGGPEVTATLLRDRFDKIFFTGSTRIGRIVAAAAARNLTPVTLELGGKCPAIVCADADVEIAARRIAWGKFMNAGQTCVAPDHVFVARSLRSAFVDALKRSVRATDGRIVNRAHFDRLTSYLGEGTILHGGSSDADKLWIEPTILTDVPPDAAVLEEEIFGPILPVIDFGDLGDVIMALRDQPAPLALYLFTRDRATERGVIARTRSGGVCINDVVSHMVGTDLPFGGVGESGTGRYHGRAGFDAFSNPRTVMRRANWPDLPFRYSPQNLSLDQLRRALRWLLRS